MVYCMCLETEDVPFYSLVILLKLANKVTRRQKLQSVKLVSAVLSFRRAASERQFPQHGVGVLLFILPSSPR